MSTEPFQELPPRDQTPRPPEELPAVFPQSHCPLPSRFWKVVLELDSWSPTERAHLSSCSHCRGVFQRVSAEARTSQGPVIGAVDLSAAPERSQPEPARPSTRGWFWGSWLGLGLSLLGSLCARLAAKPAACQRPTRRQRLGLDRLEDRDTMSSFFPWNAGWQPDIMSAEPRDRDGTVLVAAGNVGTEVAVPGAPDQVAQAWLSAFASLVWSDAAWDVAGA
jgi:hypothetical protein